MLPKKEIKIGKKFIGDKYPCYLVAELSGNHNGKLSKVYDLIDKAKSAGADAIKIQAYQADTITIIQKTKISELIKIPESQTHYLSFIKKHKHH